MTQLELDNMEYSSDANAQSAYVSNAVYGSNVITGGTPTADSQYSGDYAASKGSDGDINTFWLTDGSAFPHWWKYDLGVGVTKTVTKLRINKHWESTPGYGTGIKNFTLQGSNDDSSWDIVYTGVATESGADKVWQDFTFSNAVVYRYYKINITSTYRPDTYATMREVEAMETVLQSHSESTIKTQGTYSLKVIAAITGSSGKTLTKTF